MGSKITDGLAVYPSLGLHPPKSVLYREELETVSEEYDEGDAFRQYGATQYMLRNGWIS